jgi:hypothetical protein
LRDHELFAGCGAADHALQHTRNTAFLHTNYVNKIPEVESPASHQYWLQAVKGICTSQTHLIPLQIKDNMMKNSQNRSVLTGENIGLYAFRVFWDALTLWQKSKKTGTIIPKPPSSDRFPHWKIVNTKLICLLGEL